MSLPPLRFALLATVIGLAAAPAAHAIPTTYVSATGDDAFACTEIEPCKTFAGAFSRTDTGGTIKAINSGGYGSLSITRSVTVDGNGHLASALAGAGSNGFLVNSATATVVLKDIDVVGGVNCLAPGAGHGVRIVDAASVTIDNVRIRSFAGHGISVENTTATPAPPYPTVSVTDSEIRSTCTSSVQAKRPTAGVVEVTIDETVLANAPVGIKAGLGATVHLSDSTLYGHTTPRTTESSGFIDSLGTNRIISDAVTLLAPPQPPVTDQPPVVTVPTVPTAPPGPPPVEVKSCKVPKLAGRTLAGVRSALKKANCKLGKITYRTKRGKRRGRAYVQKPSSGTVRPDGTKVTITIAGRKPKAKASIVGGATRTWVFSGGDDVNPCSRTAPCRTWAGAQAKTTDGGTVNAIDSANYGPITVNAPITLDGGGANATIVVPAGSTGIVVNAPAGKNVTLRNISISTPACTSAGAGDGVRFVSGGRLIVEDVTVRGFGGHGLLHSPGTDSVALVSGGTFEDNCTAGLGATRPGGTALVSVTGARFVDNPTGVHAGDGGAVRLADSTVQDNDVALARSGTSTIEAWPTTFTGNGAAGLTPVSLALN